MSSFKVAILIGFSYAGCGEYRLPGMIVDLYLAYKHVTKTGFNKVLVVTDTVPKTLDPFVLNMTLQGEVDPDIESFFASLAERNELVRFTNISDLDDKCSIATRSTHLFLYYSGHAENGAALVPKYRHAASYERTQEPNFDSVDLVNLIAHSVLLSDSSCKVVCIMDCCNSNGLKLPYQLLTAVDIDDKNVPMANKRSLDIIGSQYQSISSINGRYRLLPMNNWFEGRDMVCISASSGEGKSFSSHVGSKFTLHLFRILSDENINSYIGLWFRLVFELRDIEGVWPQIRSSYPQSFFIQPWVRFNTALEIYYEKVTHVITLINA